MDVLVYSGNVLGQWVIKLKISLFVKLNKMASCFTIWLGVIGLDEEKI